MSVDGENTPKNLRDVLLNAYDERGKLNLPQSKPESLHRSHRLVPRVRIIGAESFFVGMFGGASGGAGLGYAIPSLAEMARRSINESIIFHPLPNSVPHEAYLAGVGIGLVVGLYAGAAHIAPWLEQRRHKNIRRSGLGFNS